MGNSCRERGDLEGAERHDRAALELRRRLAPDSLDVAASLNNLGEIALLRRDPDAALPLIRESLEIKEKAAPESLFVATSLVNIAEYHLRKKDLTRALAAARRSLDIRRRFEPGSLDEAESFSLLARCEHQAGEGAKAADDYRRAIDAVEAQRRRLGGADIERTAFSGRSIGYYRDTIALLHEIGKDEEAFALLERSRAHELLALIARRDLRLDDSAPAALLAGRNRLDTEYDRVQQQIARIDPVRRKEEVDKLLSRLFEIRQDRNAIDEKIWSASPRIRELEDPRTLTLQETKRELDPGTVLLSYNVGEKDSLLFALTKDSKAPIAVFDLGIGADDLTREVEVFRNLILQERDDPRLRIAREEAGRALFRRLIAPAAQIVSAGERILICPDGPLHLLPFTALTTDAGPRGRPAYLVEWRPISVSVSATVAAQLARRRTSEGIGQARLAAFGDPRAETDLPGPASGRAYRSVAERARALLPIPSSREEAESVASIFGTRGAAHLGRSATEERVEAEAPTARYLHFACHAVLDSRFPLDSALVLAPPEVEHPGSENGLLQAWEIYERLRLNADLVTLSACESALGKEAGGEGLVGLVRAFQYAGARSVLASLWNISDRSTPLLMTEFYRELRAGSSMDEALRHTQRASIQRGGRLSAPYFWSAFELFGDWR